MINELKDYLTVINEFKIDDYIKTGKLNVASSLCALRTTARIQKYFVNTNARTVDEAVVRLYSLLQGLFVSIDSLYELSYAIGESKNHININTNSELRRLRYIRNDVVGHPSSRRNDNNEAIYCILDDKSVNDDSFEYNIYASDNVIREHVDINAILEAYYKEATRFLIEIFKVERVDSSKNLLCYVVDSLKLLEANDKAYINPIDELYKNISIKNNRINWRMDLINKLRCFDYDPIFRYSIYLELVKIGRLLDSSFTFSFEKPIEIVELYRLLNRSSNIRLQEKIVYLYDSSNPLFLEVLNEYIACARMNKQENALRYLLLLKGFFEKKEDDIVYALALSLKDYKKRNN